MLKFFRKIRQNLLGESKFGRYLIYALGEILLVMIGILLALQVNNWNEAQKSRKLEIHLLKEMQKNLTLDIEDMSENDTLLSRSIRSMEVILHHLDHQLAYHDSLNAYFGWFKVYPHLWQNTSGYEMLKSVGIEAISNTKLRAAITYLYDKDYDLMKTWEREQYDYLNDYINEEMISKFSSHSNRTSIPFDYQALLKDHRFKEVIRNNLNRVRYIYNRYFKATLKNAIALKAQVDEEILILEKKK